MAHVTRYKGSPPKVGLNAHLLSLTQTYRSAGINGYIYQLLNRLPGGATPGAELEFVAYLHDLNFRPPQGLQVIRSRWNTTNPWRRILWEQSALAAASRGLDLLHCLAFAAPLAAACPTIVTVHDLSFLRFPEAFRRTNRTYLSLFTRLSVRRAARVIAGSESTRRDVIALCGAPPERVVTVPYGVSEEFRPASPDAVEAFRRNKGLPERYILFLGTLEPRKNISRLIEAYGVLRRRADVAIPKLVIAGGKGWFYETLFTQVVDLDLMDQVIFGGYVPADEVVWWYRAAEMFVYPSRFEGFGLPVLEAMASGVPTITSTASSLPEVAGNAALLVDPDDTEALAGAMNRLLVDGDLAATLREAGPRQAAQFPWARTAAETLAVYRSILQLTGGESHGT